MSDEQLAQRVIAELERRMPQDMCSCVKCRARIVGLVLDALDRVQRRLASSQPPSPHPFLAPSMAAMSAGMKSVVDAKAEELKRQAYRMLPVGDGWPPPEMGRFPTAPPRRRAGRLRNLIARLTRRDHP